MQKKNASLILVGTLAASALGANAFANSEMESSSDSPSSYEQSQSGDSWEAKKAEMQKKSSEMRAKKVAELKEKGLDVSSITPELLDATKTDEGKFWDAVKKIMNAHEIEARRAFLEKLKTQGVDVSSITEDVIADGSKFWDAVKKLQKTGSGSMSGNGASKREDKKPPVIMQKANPLSPKLRKSLETKLRAIPDDKKDEFYQRAKTVLAAQIEKAKEANKPKLVAKLEAVMAIVEDVIGPADSEDSAIIDAIFNSGSTAQ